MMLQRLRAAAEQPRFLGRTVMLLAFVGAVLVGLLAMHTIVSATPGNHDSSMSMTSPMASSIPSGMEHHAGAEGLPPNELTAGECGGACDPGHVMSGMACVLALLFTGALLFPLVSRRWPPTLATVPALTAQVLHTVWPSRPPDLTELSISRT